MTGAGHGQPAAHVRAALEADRPSWDRFVISRLEGDPLQTWAWGEVNAKFGERPLRLVAERGATLVGVAQLLIRDVGRGLTVGYVPHGPLWRRDDPDGANLLSLLLDGLRQAARRERAIVVKVDPRAARSEDEHARLAAALADAGLRRARFDLQAVTTRIVDLTGDEAAIWGRWEPDGRTRVRRARREGVSTHVDRTGEPAAVATLAALHEATAERASFRGRPAAFLADVAAAFVPQSAWLAVEARYGGAAVAAMGFLRVGDRAFYLWGGSTRDPGVTAARAPYAVLGEAIESLAADGCRSLDLWGVIEATDEATHPDAAGYSRFKRKFGGVPLRHPGTFDLIVNPAWYRLRDLRERLLQR